MKHFDFMRKQCKKIKKIFDTWLISLDHVTYDDGIVKMCRTFDLSWLLQKVVTWYILIHHLGKPHLIDLKYKAMEIPYYGFFVMTKI